MLTSLQLTGYLKTLSGDLSAFAPELAVCTTIIVLLIARLSISPQTHLSLIALLGTGVALWLAADQWGRAWTMDTDPVKFFHAHTPELVIFQGMLSYDLFTIFMRLFLMGFTMFVIILTMLTGIPDAEDSGDFYTLLLGSIVGMSMMASANNLVMVFLAVEMASVPSYALAGFLKGRRQSSEAALKYVVYGGAAAGVMLYGMSLLAGMFGTLDLTALGARITASLSGPAGGEFNPTLLSALVLVVVGLAFKLSAFPFHFWCPDVFEGAAAEVAGFLSVASKGAAVALVARFALALKGAADPSPISDYLAPIIGVMAALTATFGNLAAYGQTNLKRLLAYSTIAHAGYMMMALTPLTAGGAKAALFYLFVYLFMNLGAFAVVAFVRNQTGSEDLSTYEGLVHRAPWLAIAMSIFLLSLTGIPPLAGFVGKFQVFYVLYQEGWYALLAIGLVNTVFSLVYYVNVIRVMILAGEPGGEPPWDNWFARSYAGLLVVPLLVFGIFWSVPDDWSDASARSLRQAMARETVAAMTDVNTAPVAADPIFLPQRGGAP
jgi:NADH-quinone oxidoreductase subunit N